jgi:hypothetical protein
LICGWDADEVDEPLRHERQVLLHGVEQLTHRDRDAGVLAQLPEPRVVFRRERILEEEQVVRFERLAQVDRFVQLDALVHVVQQLDLRAQLRAQVLEQLRQHPYVGRRFPGAAAGRPAAASAVPVRGRAIRRQAGHAAWTRT